MRLPLLAMALVWIAGTDVRAADVTVLGTWTEIFSAADLTAGAGSSFPSSVQSASGITTVSVNNSLDTWRILARRAPGTWSSNLAISIRRVSNGTGLGTVSGGSSFTELTGTDQTVFSGTLDRSNIGLQFKLLGLSPSVSPDTYSSTIIFTVVSP